MLSETLLSRLTDSQRRAVLHRDGPMLVVAGPGSGKTRVVTHRVAQLLSEGVPPSAILVLTFTNKAADEMKERVRQLVGVSDVWIGTFHRFCSRLLRQYADRVGLGSDYTIYSSNDSIAAMRSAMDRLKEMDAEKDGLFTDVKYSAESIAHAVSALKSRFLDPVHEFRPEPNNDREAFLQALLPVHAHQLQLANAVDFDDLLLLTVRLFRENPTLRRQLGAQFQYVLIDEYQDTNLAQYAISHALTMETRNLMAAGDPDQSIYGWRGANISNILEFEKDFPGAEVVNLEENFRSTQFILNAAGRLIEHNTQRKPKALFSRLGDGLPVRFQADADETAEAERIASEIADALRSGVREPSDFAIFYRMNALSLNFEKALRLHGVPFRILHGTEFFDRTEIRDLLAYFRLLANPHDDEAFQRIVNVPARGIGKTSLDHLRRFAWENGFSLWEAAQHVNECKTLKNRAKQAIQAFCELILNLHFEASGKLLTLARRVVELSGYAAQFDASDELDAQRLRNVEEFLSMAGRFDETAPVPTLAAFLEQNALVSDADDVQFAGPKDVFDETPAEDEKPARNSVALMTLHAAKGLEFPVVYLTACEHGILPHERAFEDPNELEEERRLMFVGMTRAKEELNLSMAESRESAGRRSVAAPSPFLMELPREEMRMENFQATLSFDSFEFRPRGGKRSERLDESFGESPAEAVFEPKSLPVADESEAWLDEDADFAEPTDYVPRDSRPNPTKKPVSKPGQKAKPAAKPVQSDAPILKKLPAIPGLMTGADLLRQQEEDF
ncbi:MAG: UvrD-helicase domain-containing protein [Thermoguttaceae bacterium]|nr:UvrD-helicase domain-containing protein [Thermoguttaceae bacterium]